MDNELTWEWMAWTPITMAFFASIALLLAIYSVFGVLRPSLPRKGFLPIATTPGDRLFIALLGTAYLNLAWAGLSDSPQWIAVVVAIPLAITIGRWG
jgi:predicted small integral membrane protein